MNYRLTDVLFNKQSNMWVRFYTGSLPVVSCTDTENLIQIIQDLFNDDYSEYIGTYSPELRTERTINEITLVYQPVFSNSPYVYLNKYNNGTKIGNGYEIFHICTCCWIKGINTSTMDIINNNIVDGKAINTYSHCGLMPQYIYNKYGYEIGKIYACPLDDSSTSLAFRSWIGDTRRTYYNYLISSTKYITFTQDFGLSFQTWIGYDFITNTNYISKLTALYNEYFKQESFNTAGFLSCLVNTISDLLANITKTYSHTTWSTKKTWYIKVVFNGSSGKYTSNKDQYNTGNVVNYVTVVFLCSYIFYSLYLINSQYHQVLISYLFFISILTHI